MANIYDLSDTWNDGGTTFNAIKMNVTDTASASGSLLMDLQVGGSSRFKIGKDTKVVLGQSATASSNSCFWNQDVGFGLGGQTVFARGDVANLTSGAAALGNAGLILGGNFGISWSSGSYVSGSRNLILARDAANTLAQRNGTNAQTFNLYNTYTDGSNYERGFMKWNSNVLEIGTEKGTTGTIRDVKFNAWSFSFFVQGLYRVWNMDNSGHFFPHTDSTVDIGLTTKKVRKIYTDAIDGSVLTLDSLPTADPVNAGQLWNDSGTLKVSAG